ncbi:MAG: acyl-CoA dehydrogenase family protein [Planctomycetes bacterium]|nr:acyl-CoA dehydrogenase family protein [Planctomycetota bacterium]
MTRTLRSPHFTEEHQMIREAVRRFVESELTPHAQEWEAAQAFPVEVYRRMGELGFLGIHYPEALGGGGMDFFGAACMIEELTRSGMAGLNMAILVQAYMATPVIHALGTPDQQEEFLAPAIRGERIAALGVSEPGAGSDVSGIRTRAVRSGDDYVIDGQKTFITSGTRADFITLLVRTGADPHGGLSLVLFPTDTPGFRVGRSLRKMGNHTSDTAELYFEGCRIRRRLLLGEEGRGFYYLMAHFQEERLVAALAAVAHADRALEQALAYTAGRTAFGRPLDRMQVLRHRLADMACETEAARRLAYHATWLFSTGQSCVTEVSMAKVVCTETCQRVVDSALQMHGGYGYIEEYPICRAYRDVRLLTIGGGTTEVMKEIVARAVVDGREL